VAVLLNINGFTNNILKNERKNVKMKGTVIEVYIPEEYKNNNLIDAMDRKNIGFKIKTEEGIKDMVFPQDEYNANIMKNDKVIIEDNDIFLDVGEL